MHSHFVSGGEENLFLLSSVQQRKTFRLVDDIFTTTPLGHVGGQPRAGEFGLPGGGRAGEVMPVGRGACQTTAGEVVRAILLMDYTEQADLPYRERRCGYLSLALHRRAPSLSYAFRIIITHICVSRTAGRHYIFSGQRENILILSAETALPPPPHSRSN